MDQPQEKMTPEQAWNNVKRVCELYQGTLQDHQVLQHSLSVLKELVSPPKPKEGK